MLAAMTTAIGLAAMGSFLRNASPGLGLVATVFTAFLWGLMWWLVSYLLPHADDLPWWGLLPGAVFIGIGTQLLHLATVYYFGVKLGNASEWYGPLGVAATLLLWAYIVSRLVLASASINCRRRAFLPPSGLTRLSPPAASVAPVITTVAVSGYRSLRDVVVPLHGSTSSPAPTAAGKSSLYRALRLLADGGAGAVVGSLAREGGLPSALWAGPETLGGPGRAGHAVQGTRAQGPDQPPARLRRRRRVRLPRRPRSPPAVDVPHGLRPRPEDQARARLQSGPVARPGSVARRAQGTPRAGARRPRVGRADPRDGDLREHAHRAGRPRRAPELLAVATQLRSWRFYDGFRTDADAPARRTPGRHPHARARPRRRQRRRRGADDPGDRRPRGPATHHRRRLRRRVRRVMATAGRFDVALRQPGHAASARRQPSCPTAPCATCCSSPPCSRPRPPG